MCARTNRSSKGGLPLIVFAVLALLVAAPVATGQCQTEKLLAPTPSALDDFGAAVAIEGDYALVSDRCGENKGAVYAYVKTAFGWVNTETLQPPDACDAQEFGYSLALSGNTLLIGAPSDDDLGGGAGAVYYYFRDGRETDTPLDDVWHLVDKFFATLPRDNSRFGHEVVLQGDLAAIGAPGPATEPASVFIMLRDDNGTPIHPDDDVWLEEKVLVADGGSLLTEFGTALALDGDLLLIGDTRDDATGFNSGAVYVYRRMTFELPVRWVYQDKWVPKIDNEFNMYGASVDLDGEFAVVGAPGYTLGSDGRVYVYEYNHENEWWDRLAIIDNPTGHLWSAFGTAVAASDGRAIASAPLLGFGFYRGGRAWMFEGSDGTWFPTMDFQAADEQLGDHFGEVLDVSNGMLLVGSPGFAGIPDESVLPVVGSGAVVDLEAPSPWTGLGNGFSFAVPEPRLCGWGVPAEGWPMSLKMYQAPALHPTALVVGLSVIYAPFKGGTLVPKPDLLIPVLTDGAGEFCLVAPWVPDGIVPSRTPFTFQVWFQDPVMPFGWAATNGSELRTP